jgi:hypothetical protein
MEISDKAEVQINEYFIASIHIISSTGSSLTEELKAQLAALEAIAVARQWSKHGRLVPRRPI